MKNSGSYGGVEKKFFDNLNLAATLRTDKNVNFNWLFTPALSAVYSPFADKLSPIVFSVQPFAIRHYQTILASQCRPCLLVGNLMGFDSLITIESFQKGLENPQAIDTKEFVYFNAPPIRPEKVKTFEIGYGNYPEKVLCGCGLLQHV